MSNDLSHLGSTFSFAGSFPLRGRVSADWTNAERIGKLLVSRMRRRLTAITPITGIARGQAKHRDYA